MNRIGDVLRDLYRDLRDRRLLPVVIALAAAIVAVPILLGGGSSEPVPPTPPADATAAGGVAGSDALSPVVLAEVPGLRNFRERLDRFRRRDPFNQQMVGSHTAQGGAGNLEPTGSSTTASTASTAPTSTSASDTTSPSQAPSGSSPNGATPGGGSHGGGGKPDHRVVETTIDVRVGAAGATKVLRGVESLRFLPGENRPVVQFVEGDADGTHAAFVVSRKVTETAGDGKCDPGRNDCQYLLMSPGDLRTFVYGDEHETYRLQLLAIHRHEVVAKPAAGD